MMKSVGFFSGPEFLNGPFRNSKEFLKLFSSLLSGRLEGAGIIALTLGQISKWLLFPFPYSKWRGFYSNKWRGFYSNKNQVELLFSPIFFLKTEPSQVKAQVSSLSVSSSLLITFKVFLPVIGSRVNIAPYVYIHMFLQFFWRCCDL